MAGEEPGLPPVPAAEIDHRQRLAERADKVVQVGLEVAYVGIPDDLPRASLDPGPPALPGQRVQA